MRMLDNLKAIMDELEKEDEWAHEFVTDILIKKEENPSHQLTKKQFNKLVEIHDKYFH